MKYLLLVSLLLQACEAPPVCDTQKNICYHAPTHINVAEEKKKEDFEFGFFLGFFMAMIAADSGSKSK